MFCYQCQEAAKNSGCTVRGVCGKEATTSDLQDLLMYTVKGLSTVVKARSDHDAAMLRRTGRFITRALFATITNTNFDDSRFYPLIREGLALRDELATGLPGSADGLPDCAVWKGHTERELNEKAQSVGILTEENEDVRSLQEIIVYGLKGLAAYTHHAEILGYEDEEIYRFTVKTLAALTGELSADELTNLVLETGSCAVKAMALLDRANIGTYGNPEITTVNLGVRDNPGILVSGHDLKDLEELLEQTTGTGVDVYTHGEMLPAHYYPAFKKYDHFAGNYGNSWWKQNKEFASFNGPIVMTTNCITPVKDTYKDRIYTTDIVGYPGVTHIPDRDPNGPKDFSGVIEQAKTCPPPTSLESGELVGGFAHNQVLQLADKVVEAVKSGAIKKFIVMAGCDGRQSPRSYFTEVAEKLPEDAVILTAGCAKYRYNKLNLGDIGDIPRVLDAGQCNDSYSLAVIALKLKEVFGLDDINELPIEFDIAWYEQKAVAVLLALLSLGFKGIRLGPTLPAFVSPNVAKVLTDNFDLKPITDPDIDIKEMMPAG
jgi:hydroxylamine reductase